MKMTAAVLLSADRGFAALRDEARRQQLIAQLEAGTIEARKVVGNHPLRQMTTALMGLGMNDPSKSDPSKPHAPNADFFARYPQYAGFGQRARQLLSTVITAEMTFQSLGDASGHTNPFSAEQRQRIAELIDEAATLANEVHAALNRHPELAHADAAMGSRSGEKLGSLGDKKGWDAIKDLGQYGTAKLLREEVTRQTRKFFTADHMQKKFGDWPRRSPPSPQATSSGSSRATFTQLPVPISSAGNSAAQDAGRYLFGEGGFDGAWEVAKDKVDQEHTQQPK
ncbi:hypothetical protein D3870_02450 [Noviherbaspirillum cavernae]|uniref:Uncharacterized protein n=2 Tax=Noviherbaspirillum cavernae TaxID=2320862 RepID=A0A418WXR9_9BURK|nr:hypothetical protein D3870_02450 [Noviherbaspirillum cavernae]